MVRQQIEKAHMGTWGHLCRRAVAFALAAAMSLSLLPATARAASAAPITPTQVTAQSDFPKIEFQTNFVRTEYGSLTGMMELAIRVGPSATVADGPDAGLPIPVDFQAVAATLQYNTTLYKPVSWSWLIPEDKSQPLPAVLPLDADRYYDVQLPAMKDDTIPGTGAIAQCGIVPAGKATGMSDDVVSGDQALLFFKAEAYGPAVTLTEMTTLAVIRFYVNPELMKRISIERDKTSFSPEWGYNYNVLFDGTMIADRNALDTAILSYDWDDTSGGAGTADTLTLPAGFVSVGFAADSDMARSHSPAGMALDYSAGDNEFYFVPGCIPPTDEAPTNDTLEEVTIYIRADGSTTTTPISGAATAVDLVGPETEGDRVLAVDPANNDPTDPARYSYLSNLIPSDNVSFPIVSQLSFADKGDGRENMIIIAAYDWDNTLIGAVVVPRNDDARAIFNAYVRDNMIYPTLRFDEEGRFGSTNTNLIDSMARLYTYRGKIPATGPAPDGAVDSTVVADGALYPLTAKIDYSFVKRPLELVERSTTDIGEPVSVWKQPGETEAEWDYEYPYIHGWALIPDDDMTDIQYTHPDNLWTTIGVGELTEYNGARAGGYVELNNAPAELTVEGQEFTIANFDFSQNPQPKGTVYAVKAIYEPAEDLLFNGNAYRMVAEPYYNKMNYPTAAFGAAYSVEITFERTNFDSNGLLHGVSRARDLALRQETTSDIRWENEYLENATIAQQSAKTKTTFSTVPVDNVDEVYIQLVLSGRHNKVDYYLMEAYGYSFVTGGERSRANSTFTGTAHTLDNYNYKTADNNVDPIYYQAEYIDTDGDGRVNDDRSGSYGFVLFCTLNSLAQKTTEYNNNELSETDFNLYVNMDVFADINLRVENNPVSARNERTVQNAWKAAAQAAQTAHNGGDNRWWDVEHDCAQFTYHVIQHYVSDYVANDSATLRDPAVAENQTITWCNLHEECASARTGKPNSLVKMVRAALAGEKDKLILLTLDEAENLAHLRANERGTAYSSISALADAMIDAVQGINTIKPWPGTINSVSEEDWDAIQGWILSATKPTDTKTLNEAIKLSKDTAWWNKGESAPGTGNLAALVAAEKKAVETGRDAWINYYRYREAFTDMKTTGVSPTSQWTRITENLVKNIDGEPFDTYEEFKAAFRAAVPLVPEPTPEAPDPYYWYKLQYIMAGDTRTPEADQYDKYWWHNGYSRVTDLPSLFVAAQQAVAGDPTIWNMFTLDDLYDLVNLHFRSGFNGTTDKYTDITVFKSAVLNFIAAPGAIIARSSDNAQQKLNSWNQLQYYLIHKDDEFDYDNDGVKDTIDLTQRATTVAIQAENPYYWWRDAGVGSPYALSPGAGDYSITTLMEAVYRYTFNGNPHALDNLDESAATAFRLIPSYTGTEENWNDLTKYDAAAIDGLKAKLYALAQIVGGVNCRNLTWRQIQHYLLTDTYLSATDSNLPTDTATDKDGAVKNYWWRQGDANPNLVTDIKNDLETFLDIIDQFAAGTYDGDFYAAADLYSGATEGEGTRLNLYGGWAYDPMPIAYDFGSMMDFEMSMENIAYELNGTPAADVLDWFVLQYYALTDNAPYWGGGEPIISKADAKSYYLQLLSDNGLTNWAPSYVDVSTASLLDMTMFSMMAMGPDTTVETDPATGIATVTTVVETYLEETEMILVVTTVVTIDPATGTTTTTVTTVLMDGENNILSETTTTDVAQTTPEEPTQPEEPVCICGAEDDVHSEDCPLYVTPEAPEEPEEGGEDAAQEPVCTCGTEDDIHGEDCPLYILPDSGDPDVEIEAPEPTETPEPETTEPPEPTETPEPEVTETPEPTEPPEPTESPEPTETPEPSKPEGSLETMPEVIKNPDMEPEPPEPTEPDEPDEDDPDVGDAVREGGEAAAPDDPPEVVVEETPPPLGTLQTGLTRSGTTDYKRLTTKITTSNRRPETGQTKLLARAGGVKMKQLKLKRIISPPGRRGLPLLLRTELTERRRAL